MNRLLLCGAVAVVLGGSAFGQTVVVPNANANVAGNPSGLLSGSPSSLRAQTVIDPSQLPNVPISITGFAYRAAPGTGAVTETVSGTISMSNSPNWPNSTGHTLLSATFASNVGSNNTLVSTFSGAIISAPSCSGPGPCPFGSVATLTTPFNYNPANGPLLMDSQVTSISAASGQLDNVNCSAATCVINSNFGTPVGTATGSLNSAANIMQIAYTVIPATPVPPSILLTLAGLAMVGFYVGTRGVKFA